MSETSAKAQIRDLATKVQACVEDANLTWSEKHAKIEQYEVDLHKAQAELEVHRKAREVAGAADAGEQEKTEKNRAPRILSLGAQVTGSDAYKALVAKRRSGGKYDESFEIKTAPAPEDDGSQAGGDPVMNTGGQHTADGYSTGGNIGGLLAPVQIPGIVQQLFPPLAIAALFPQGPISGTSLRYIKETGWTNNASAVAEGGKKPTSTAQLDFATEVVGKIANVMRVTDELIEDADAFMSFLNSRLTLGVQHVEEHDLLLANGAPSVNGLLRRTGLQAPRGVPNIARGSETQAMEAVYRMITQIRVTAFVEPDWVVANPLDWQNIRLAKDVNGQYYGGGPFTGAYGNSGPPNVDSLFGQRVLTTPRMPDAATDAAHGGMLVGGFQEGAQIFRKSGISVQLTNSHEDDFTHDRVAMRAEERLLLAVWRAGAFGLCQPTWSLN